VLTFVYRFVSTVCFNSAGLSSGSFHGTSLVELRCNVDPYYYKIDVNFVNNFCVLADDVKCQKIKLSCFWHI
jgi:hypothetical protein